MIAVSALAKSHFRLEHKPIRSSAIATSAVRTARHAVELLDKEAMRDETRKYVQDSIQKLLAEFTATPEK